MPLSSLDPPPPWAPWGKASDEGTHPLICHVLDTAAVAERLMPLVLGPRLLAGLRDSFACLTDWEGWVALFCGVHDLGKYAPTFQACQADVAEARLPRSAYDDVEFVRSPKNLPRADTPHGLITALHLHGMLKTWGMPRESALRIAVALGGHHGVFPKADMILQARRQHNHHGGERWAEWRTALVHEVSRLRGLPEPENANWSEVRVSLEAAIGLAALTSISDWIASDTQNFPPRADEVDLDDYKARADLLAEDAIAKIDLAAWRPPADTTFAALFPDKCPPRPMQTAVERLTTGRAEPVLLVVEAPTGEGKSMATLQAAAALVRSMSLAGVYIGMPTQATSNQMLGVVQAMLSHLGDTTNVRLIHSAAAEHSPVTPVDVGQDEAEDSTVKAREWFTRKRALLTRWGVGTVDQALKTAIRSHHGFVRLAALSGKVVVIDEVHAYDIHMSTLLDRMLHWLGRLGVSVVLLSATLPSGRRHELVAAWRSGLRGELPEAQPPAPTTEYPRVTWADHERVDAEHTPPSRLNANREIVLDRVEDVEGWLIQQSRTHDCIAVVHNLVERVVSTCHELERRFADLPAAERPEIIPITGRMTAKERRDTEARLKEHFGKEGSRPRAIVVGTQVLEQSLDLDFDVMLSDMAPIDSLIQRAGRIRRHRSEDDRPGPITLGITGVTDTEGGPRFPRYTTLVYARMTLLRTCALLAGRRSIRTPDQVQSLIDSVYGPEFECPDGWEDGWAQAADQLARSRDRERRNAEVLRLPLALDGMDIDTLTARPKSSTNTRPQRR
ncbi:CRISPR-associated helicase Cas3' [Actinokineospora sp. NPDC004072]